MVEYISRNAVITTIKNYGKGAITEGMKTLDPVDDIVALAGAIEWLQVADVAPVVHGRWEMRRNSWYCVNCNKGYKITYGLIATSAYNYCPNCGAKMDGGSSK